MSNKKKENPQKEEPHKEDAARACAEGENADTPTDSADDSVTFTRQEAEQMEQMAKELVSMKDQHLRLAAEYDNYRKRTAKEKEQTYSDAKMATIKEFLAIYDNLERAVGQADGEDSPHKKGMEMIFHQFQEILGKLGVTEIEALGKTFDPDRHSAVMHVDDDAVGENTVVEVFQRGFLLGDKVLRFAVVKVAN